MKLTSDKLNDVLSLFSLVILSDGKVYPEEVSVMGNQLSKLLSVVDPNILFSPEMGRDWFANNRKSLKMLISVEDNRHFIDIALMKLKDAEPKLKKMLVYAMIRIAWADGEFHDKEEYMVKRAEDIWKIDLALTSDRAKTTHQAVI